jgi:hypothetical protein
VWHKNIFFLLVGEKNIIALQKRRRRKLLWNALDGINKNVCKNKNK